MCGYTTQGNTVDLEEILNRLVVTRAVPRIDYQTATIARSVEITIVWQATPSSKKTQQLAWLEKKVAPSKVNNATFRSHGYNGIFRITHIASHCTGKTIVSRPIARIGGLKGGERERGKRDRGWKRGRWGWNTNGTDSRTNGPCSRQKSYVRPIHPKRLCAFGYSYFNANKRNGTEETLQEEYRYTPTLGQVTQSCAV